MISPWKAALLVLIEAVALIGAGIWYFQQPSLYSRTLPSADPSPIVASAPSVPASIPSVPASTPSVPSEPAQSLAHPWLATPVARGAILVDRHLHKNGGSTMRTILHANERAGVCQYWGYWQTWYGWTNFTHELERRLFDRPLASAPPSSLPWVCVEAHASQMTINFMPDVVPLLARLRESLELSRVPMRVLLVTRVREPLSFYLSYFKWKVAGLQRAQRRNRWGRSFAEWAPHNLQAFSLLRGGIDEIAGPLYMDKRLDGERFGAAEMAELRAGLRAFDIVAPLRFFDEHLLMIADAVGLPHLAYKQISPAQNGMDTPLTDADVCPNMTACRALIRQIAPWDHVMYREASARFRARLAAQPPAFRERLALFRAARHAHKVPATSSCCALRMKCHNKQTGEWRAHPPTCVPGWDAEQKLVVDDMGGMCCVPAPTKNQSRPHDAKALRAQARRTE